MTIDYEVRGPHAADLPPLRDDMNLATPEMFTPLGPDSYRSPPGFPAISQRSDVPLQWNDRVGVRFLRGTPEATFVGSPWHMHDYDFSITYITQGWADFEFEGVGVVRFVAGTVFAQPPRNRHRELIMSHDFEAIGVASPAAFTTTVFVYDEETGTFDEMIADVEHMENLQKFAAMQEWRYGD